MRLALYQPDMPQNVGAAIRVAACFDAAIDIIGPCGFAGGERDIRRVAMDYALAAPPVLHDGWRAFLSAFDSSGVSASSPAGAVSTEGAGAAICVLADKTPIAASRRLPPERGRGAARVVLLTTRGAADLWGFRFAPGDVILLGRESAGVPDEVHEAADAQLRIPLAPGARALNVAVAGAVALAEARRQIGWI